jgi:hypothetical protein
MQDATLKRHTPGHLHNVLMLHMQLNIETPRTQHNTKFDSPETSAHGQVGIFQKLGCVQHPCNMVTV